MNSVGLSLNLRSQCDCISLSLTVWLSESESTLSWSDGWEGNSMSGCLGDDGWVRSPFRSDSLSVG